MIQMTRHHPTLFLTVLVSVLTLLASTGFAASQSQSPNISVGPNLRLTSGEYNECWITASLTNPKFLVAVAQAGAGLAVEVMRNCLIATSKDGGQTWQEAHLPGW